MTTIITRLYADAATANSVASGLVAKGLDESDIDIITGHGTGDPVQAMRAARVNPVSAKAYAGGLGAGRALLVVRAPFAPFGTARQAMRMVDAVPSIKAGVANENEYIREQPSIDLNGSIMRGHPLLMSNAFHRPSHNRAFGSNTVIKSKPRTSAIAGGAHVSTKFWPMRLVSATAKKSTSAIRGGMLISALFGLPMLTGRLPR